LLAALLALAAPAARGEEAVSLHGNGAWSYERTDENVYGFADPDGEWDTAMFDLLVSARPVDHVVLTTQLGFDRDEVELEWAFAEWRVADALRLRAGKVKQPLGNYMELEFVGTARPFFHLPTSVYGPAEIGATSYSGAGLTGEVPLGGSGLSLAYDAYGGAVILSTYEPFDALEPGFPGGAIEEEELEVENVAGGRLSLVTPWDVTLRASGFGGRTETDEEGGLTLAVYGLSLWYRGERLWLSAEGFRATEVGFEDRLAAYVEAAWFLTPRWQVAARYEAARVELDEVDVSSPLLRHDEWGAGASFWITPQVVARASVHGVRGERFVEQDEDADEVAGRTLRVVAGVQFTF
jgi:hypothetical protein